MTSTSSSTTNMDKIFDVCVVGLGIHGSSIAAALSKRKQQVIGLEKYGPNGHAQGSTHGRSRIFRVAYFEDPAYVPLLKRSVELWKELDAYSLSKGKSSLMRMTGALMMGKKDSAVIQGTLASVHTHHLDHEMLNATQIKERYPVFEVEEDDVAVLEQSAGYLNPELCVENYQQQAIEHGAELHFNESLVSYTTNTIEKDGELVVAVTTNTGITYFARKIVLSVGAWAPETYGSEISIQQTVERRVLYWFEPTAQQEHFQNIPVYIYDMGKHANFYGFPAHDIHSNDPIDRAVKIAIHQVASVNTSHDSNNNNNSNNDNTTVVADVICTPSTVNREVNEQEIKDMRSAFAPRLPSLNGELIHTCTCLYTCIKDDFFLLDWHPKYQQNKNVLLLSACSGHGFKFGSVLGEVVASMLIDGDTALPFDISMFRLNPNRI